MKIIALLTFLGIVLYLWLTRETGDQPLKTEGENERN